ncbi:MAG: serine/threonine-protein kinase [Myxococcales bacterium]|nr:serine/threonine protein kinase [Myxococcota bacterium]MDW8280136.1 serine/threonine-protein kinase [Myxococcales bacterium]
MAEPSKVTSLTRTCASCGQEYPWLEAHFCPLRGIEVPRQLDIIGTIIDGRYEVQSRLGEGGMGIVYKARHIHLEKPVAIKILRNKHDPEAWARFKQEARSASAVNHSNIVSVMDFGVLPDGHAYIVMEFLVGRTLTAAIGRRPMGTLRSLHIAVQIARGLQAVHEAGIIHRDLKPDNVFLQDREGQRDLVKIMDFGVAKVESSARLTAHGMVMGTAEYISPEQASGRPVDARCDQYALGCILYEMLTGQQVFVAEGAAVLMKMHVYDQPVPPRQRCPEADIPPQLEAIVMRLLQKNPAERFASMAEVSQVLQAELDAQLQAPAQGISIPRLLVHGTKRSRMWLLGGMLVMLGVGGGLALVGSLRSSDPSRPLPRQPDQGARPAIATEQPALPPPSVATEAALPTPREEREPARSTRSAKARKSEVDTSQPLTVLFQPLKPAHILLSCTPSIITLCHDECTVTIPAGAGQCIASADGFASKPFPYSVLQSMRKRSKGPLRMKVVLADLRNR